MQVVTSDPYDTDPGFITLNTGTNTVSVLMTTAGNQTITASGAGISNTSDIITINPNPANQLIAVLKGQTRTQGKPTVPVGKTGTVSQIFAGQPLTVNVYAVDQYYNLDPTSNATIYTDLRDDPFDVTPAPLALVAGATGFVLDARSPRECRSFVSTGSLYQQYVLVIFPEPFTQSSPDTDPAQIQIQLVLAGESAVPGKPPYAQQNGGKTGSPNPQYAGLGSTVSIRLVDRFYNLITVGASMPTVTLNTTDPNDNAFGFDPVVVSLVNGVRQATVTFVTANNPFSATTNPNRNRLGWQIQSDGGGLYTADVSTWVATWPGDIVKLRLLASNQQALEGSDPVGAGRNQRGIAGVRRCRQFLHFNRAGGGPILE